MFKIGWLSTGGDKEAMGLLETTKQAIDEGIIPDSEICWVFSNRVEGENPKTDDFLKYVESIGASLACRSSSGFRPSLRESKPLEWRRQFDKSILRSLEGLEKPDIVVLAGFMLIVSPVLCEAFDMINLHPALPNGPKGTWQEVEIEVVEKKLQETGAMVHEVIKECDAGRPLTFYRVRIIEHVLGKVRELQKKYEESLLILTLRDIAMGLLKIGKVDDLPLDLTQDVKRFLV